jgi:hypothetical protein
MIPPGFEPTIPASERPQTHALHRAATGIGNSLYSSFETLLFGFGKRIPSSFNQLFVSNIL